MWGARASTGNHVELNATGYLGNKDDSQITSITSIQANFTTLGTLTLATSFDGINYTQTSIVSGSTNQTSSLPYHFRLTANGNPVAISSVVITYSCALTLIQLVNKKTTQSRLMTLQVLIQALIFQRNLTAIRILISLVISP